MSNAGTGLVDSGSGTAGYKAHKRKLSWDAAVQEWRKARKHRLWIKAALRAFRKAGGYVPTQELT
jgi:hypothetical protein